MSTNGCHELYENYMKLRQEHNRAEGRIGELEAELADLKTAADPEALVIAYSKGYADAREKYRADNAQLRQQLTEAMKWVPDVLTYGSGALSAFQPLIDEVNAPGEDEAWAHLQEEWQPVDHVLLDDGLELDVDELAFTIARGNTALDTYGWPEDGYAYAVMRRVVGQEE